MTVRRRAAVLLAVGTLGTWGCGGYGSYCSERISCAQGNDADEQACEIEATAEEDLADVAGCSDEFEEYFACVEESSVCIDGEYSARTTCESQEERLESCKR